ncbi:MAG: ComEC/Rec2 family competence protein [Elusimicrobia bacterium]|nr:ComEC/Rec2 family competence protein [Elusimicrobiota bacterium]
MHHVKKNAPAPAVLKAVFAAVFSLLAVLHFSAPSRAESAIDQLRVSAPETQVPLAPVPSNATLYTAAPGLNVYFINVGQGDSIYIELPGGHNALIDGGPSNYPTSSLAHFLAAKHVTAIDDVLLTHPHSDHYNGLQYVFDNLTVRNFYDTRVDNTGTKADEKLRQTAHDKGVTFFYPEAGQNMDWSEPGVDLKVFNACQQPLATNKGEVLNNCSIMFKLSYKGASVLFTGDVQGSAEGPIVAKYGRELKADVLKVGHHGSKYSSTMPFLQAVKPSRAYIEVGADNNYGHPTQEALGRLQEVGAKIFRTDQDDTMEFSMDGSSLDVPLTPEGN